MMTPLGFSSYNVSKLSLAALKIFELILLGSASKSCFALAYSSSDGLLFHSLPSPFFLNVVLHVL